MLSTAGAGFGALALAGLNQSQLVAGPTSSDNHNPVRATTGHVAPRAKNIIFLFMEGGPSHIDMFDLKPMVNQLAGQSLPASFGPIITAMGETDSPILASKRRWHRHGESGMWVSDWLPNLAECVDDMCMIHSLWGDGINHSGGVCQMNTGSIRAGRPSLGAWVSYGLGTANNSLPAFVVMQDRKNRVVNAPSSWGSGFMPAVYQGTPLKAGEVPIPNLANLSGVSDARQQSKVSLLKELNNTQLAGYPDADELEARIASYELAFRMQAEAPEAIDLSNETTATHTMYGIDEKETESFGRNCLMARRLVERGVRFVQIYHGAGSAWDSHANLEKDHTKLCREMDKPVSGLLRDLKQRGLLDETLVVWGGEFGRTPMSEKGNGRDHNAFGFTMWLAGGGSAAGKVVGATDELGLHAVENRIHVHDFHATLLHLLGIDHTQLLYRYNGRPERPTVNEGHVVDDLIA